MTAVPFNSVEGHSGSDDVLGRAVSRAKRRIVPFMILMYMLAYLDRVNIGFAKPSFQATTGVSDAAFAFGAGVFFLTYAAFEIPSNLVLHKVGARKWLARIMITWGLVSACMMFASSDTSFSAIRLVLGATEAGLFPGAILYFTYWFPSQSRGKVLSIFYFGTPLALIFGGPISGLFLDLDGLFGLHGWQLMFLFEGLFTVLVGLFAIFYLTDRPADAHWLREDERRSLQAAFDAEESHKAQHGQLSLGKALRTPRILHFALIYMLIQVTGLGVAFYLPTQVGALLGTKVGLMVGLVSAIPWICALVAGYLYPDFAIRLGRRRSFLVVSLLSIGVGLVVSANGGPLVAIAALCFVTMGIMTAQPIFWTYPTEYLGGVAAAGGLALINALGGLGGFLAPNLRTGAEQLSGSPAYGLYAIAAAAFLAVPLVLLIPQSSSVKR